MKSTELSGDREAKHQRPDGDRREPGDDGGEARTEVDDMNGVKIAVGATADEDDAGNAWRRECDNG